MANEIIHTDIVVDEEGNPVDPDNLDWSIGYTTTEEKFVKHVPATEGRPTLRHYEVNWIELDDGEKITIEDSYNSPWIKMIDDKNGTVDFIPQDGRDIVAIDFKEIIDDPGESAKEGYDVYESYAVWHLYTEEQLAEREAAQKAQEEQEKIEAQREEFLSTGPERLSDVEAKVNNAETNIETTDQKLTETEIRLSDTEVNVEDLTLMMAEMIGAF